MQNPIMKWLDKLPTIPFGVVAIMLALAPFTPEPHLWEKLKMLAAGELSTAIDIFDLFFHATPITLFLIKIIRLRTSKTD